MKTLFARCCWMLPAFCFALLIYPGAAEIPLAAQNSHAITTPRTITPSNYPYPDRGLVTAVYDGDTVKIEFQDGVEKKVRLIGIDSPEIDDAREDVSFWAHMAKRFAFFHLYRKEVAPQLTRSLVVPYEDLESAIDTVPLLIREKVLPMAVEFVEREVITITEEYLKKKWPCSTGRTYLLIILDASSEEEMDKLSESVASVCLEKGAKDVFIADTQGKQDQVLEIRSKIYEAIKAQTIDILDISIPRAEIARHVRRIQEISQKYDIWLPTFGHAADGNVHTHIMKARYEGGKVIPFSGEELREKFEKARAELYQDCKNRGGVISGEHGIGLVKKKFLSLVLDQSQMELMKGIKRAFDPDNILNPNKIFD